jgi:hypothetical protein
VARPDTRGPQRALQHGRLGQRVPAAGTGRAAQLGIEIDEDRARQVTGPVVVAAGRPGEPPAHVE